MPVYKRYPAELILRVKDVMSSPPIVVPEDATIEQAARKMWDERVGSVLVVNRGKLTGIVTERDMLFALARSMVVGKVPVAKIMSRNVIAVDEEEQVAAAIQRMRQANIKHLPVIKTGGKPVGIISLRDLLDAGVSFVRVLLPE